MAADSLSLHPVLLYLACISIATFCLFTFDKWKARAGWWRVPEKTLLILCLLGGTVGGGVAMMLFRHKISKHSFLRRYFAIVALQVVAFTGWWFLNSR